MRFAIEIGAAVREEWPQDKPVFFRLSAVDGKGGSWRLSDSIALAKALRAVDIDVVDVSSGGVTGSSDMPMVLERIAVFVQRQQNQDRLKAYHALSCSKLEIHAVSHLHQTG